LLSYEGALQVNYDPVIKNNADRIRGAIYAKAADAAYNAGDYVKAKNLYEQALWWLNTVPNFPGFAQYVAGVRKGFALATARSIPVEPPTVDAQKVSSGLSPEIEAQIPDTPAGRWIHKAFVVINDPNPNPDRWADAHAEFGAALLEQPGDAGIQRLVELSDYMMHLKVIKYPDRAWKAALSALDQYSETHR
jgi:hypothetical protein